MTEYKPIAESPHFIILDKYEKPEPAGESYQSEAELEKELIRDLAAQGYEYLPEIKTPEALLANARTQIQNLNNIGFTDAEWLRFVESWLDKPGESMDDKTARVYDNYICDFTFDDGALRNIYLFDKKTIARNKLQVINQLEQAGSHANRYDVTILVNGLPLVQVELKKRGVAIREAFNQIHRYSKESFNSDHSLFKYLQIFVISNGTDTRYFANTTRRDKNSYDYTMNWALSDNSLVRDLGDFTATFFQKNTLLEILLRYSVLDANGTLLIMRPYQIAATERILWKIKSSHNAKNWSKPESGGYVWHTTGSGKTLTSFKAARLASGLDFIDKVLFVVDRKDLDYQTMKEYQRFSPDSVNGSRDTAGLKRNLDKDDNRIVVTTIQKLNNLMKAEASLAIYDKNVVFIFDECHRSQFGEAQKNLRARFKKYFQFGFTGTPIFPENARGSETTAGIFGRELHAYVITDAIRDEKVLKFKVDYNDVRPRFRYLEAEKDEEKLTAAENKRAFLHPERIRQISRYILDNFAHKTHRGQNGGKGFNAMFAVSSVDAAKTYYETFKNLQKDAQKPLKVATIFSFAANEEQNAIGEIRDESFNVSALDSSAKEFLGAAINDYNGYFGTSFAVDGDSFQNYYRDLSNRMKQGEVDLLIVVGMFLTGFDAPGLNTLFVDKNLRYHGLLQAFSRTNRILDARKTFGNIVTFRNLEQDTVDAITLFGDKNTRNVVLEKSYQEYMQGFVDSTSGQRRRGFLEVVRELGEKFPDPARLEKETDKKEFVKLFGEYLRLENLLQNYDEFTFLKAFQRIDPEDAEQVEKFRTEYFLDDGQIGELKKIPLPPERKIQDYKSVYNDVRDWLRRQKSGEGKKTTVDWNDVVFEVELLKTEEINLDYILGLIYEKHKANADKKAIIIDARRLIRASIGNRAKEGLIVDFIEMADFSAMPTRTDVIKAFFAFAREERQREAEELIEEEKLNAEQARRYMAASLKREYASENGMGLKSILPIMSPLNPKYLGKKRTVFQKICAFVEKFKGIGGNL